MPSQVVLADKVLSESECTAVINAPIEQVDIAEWLLNLPEAEYQRCAPPDHIAAGYTTTDDGRPMSINVEQIGSGLMIQHYVGEVTDKHLCRMVSLSDVFTPQGRSTVEVTWTLSVTPIDPHSCEYRNSVRALATSEFMEFIATQGISFEQAAAARQTASGDHNRRETPLFAKSIERKALTN
ncbi:MULTISPECIES: hypothetical protein [unclassified Nocardia]|uniref:hypothetical protein n=1 Tax=unclassified Nocardia TaxID=2637762 RepID=UPI001CE47204|nr:MULTISPECIES: hypothetical protein [unclassified Nocardia]